MERSLKVGKRYRYIRLNRQDNKSLDVELANIHHRRGTMYVQVTDLMRREAAFESSLP
jgi:hypothetical protein